MANEVTAPNPFIASGSLLMSSTSSGRTCTESGVVISGEKMIAGSIQALSGTMELGSAAIAGGFLMLWNATNAHATSLTGGTPSAPVNLSLPLVSGNLATEAYAASTATTITQSTVAASLEYDSYVPTCYKPAGSNVTSVSGVLNRWFRIGNIISVSGQFSVTPTAASTLTTFEMSLPVFAGLADPSELSGTAVDSSISPACSIRIYAHTTQPRAVFQWLQGSGTAAMTCGFQFTYQA